MEKMNIPMSKLDDPNFKLELKQISNAFQEASIMSFKVHECLDCGTQLKKTGAMRCRKCNMRKIGKHKRKS